MTGEEGGGQRGTNRREGGDTLGRTEAGMN